MGSLNSDWGRVTFWISTSWRCKLYSNWTNVCDKKLSIKQCTKVLMTGEWSFFHIQGDRCWCHTCSLLMGNSCLWEGLSCGTCQFPHPPGNILYFSATFSTLYSIRATQRFGWLIIPCMGLRWLECDHVRKVVGAVDVKTEMLILHCSCVHATTSGYVKWARIISA